MGLGVIGIDSKRFEIFRLGFFPLALFGERQGKVVVAVFVFRVEFHRLFVMRDGFINFPSSQQLGSAVQKISGSIEVGLIRLVRCEDIARYHRRSIRFLPDSAGAFGFGHAWKLFYDTVSSEIGPGAQNSQTDYHHRNQQPGEPHLPGTRGRCGFPDRAFLLALHETVASVWYPRSVAIVLGTWDFFAVWSLVFGVSIPGCCLICLHWKADVCTTKRSDGVVEYS